MLLNLNVGKVCNSRNLISIIYAAHLRLLRPVRACQVSGRCANSNFPPFGDRRSTAEAPECRCARCPRQCCPLRSGADLIWLRSCQLQQYLHLSNPWHRSRIVDRAGGERGSQQVCRSCACRIPWEAVQRGCDRPVQNNLKIGKT